MNLFRTPVLTPGRVGLAFVLALAADALQVLLGPFGWTFLDEFIDLIALVGISYLIGFHPMLLPTFLVEIIPIVDMLPTWTGCVALVVALRRKQQPGASPPPVAKPSDVIDV
ncbi:MAG: hypothetical protein FJ398_02125 [Verrucomicrobia bacterium]|nr:hypothetical protein [Verrucomicrobiota bacterium]